MHRYGPLQYSHGKWLLGDVNRRHLLFTREELTYINPGMSNSLYTWNDHEHMELRLAKSRIPSRILRDYFLPIIMNVFALGDFSEQSYSYLEMYKKSGQSEALTLDNEGVGGYFKPTADKTENLFDALSTSSNMRNLLDHPDEVFKILKNKL